MPPPAESGRNSARDPRRENRPTHKLHDISSPSASPRSLENPQRFPNKRQGSHSPRDRPSKLHKTNHQGSLSTPKSPSADSRRSSVASILNAPPSRRDEGHRDRASQQLQLEMDETTRKLALRSASSMEDPLPKANGDFDGLALSPNVLQNGPDPDVDGQESSSLEALLIKYSYNTAVLSMDMVRSQQAAEHLQQAETEFGACRNQFEQFPVVRERKSRARADARRLVDIRKDTQVERTTNVRRLAKQVSALIGLQSRVEVTAPRTDHVARDEFLALQTRYDALLLKRKADEDAINASLDEMKASCKKSTEDLKAAHINIKNIQEDTLELGKKYGKVAGLDASVNDTVKRFADIRREVDVHAGKANVKFDSILTSIGTLDASIVDTASTASRSFNAILGEQASLSKKIHEVSTIVGQVRSIESSTAHLRQDLDKLQKMCDSMPHKATTSLESSTTEGKKVTDSTLSSGGTAQDFDKVDPRLQPFQQKLDSHDSHIARLHEWANQQKTEAQRLLGAQEVRDQAIITHMNDTFATITELTDLDTKVTERVERCMASIPARLSEAVGVTHAASKSEADDDLRESLRRAIDETSGTVRHSVQRVSEVENRLTALARNRTVNGSPGTLIHDNSQAQREMSLGTPTGNQASLKQNAPSPEWYGHLQRLRQELDNFRAQVEGVKIMMSSVERRYTDLTTEHVVQAMANKMSTMYPDIRNCQVTVTNLQTQLDAKSVLFQRCTDGVNEVKHKISLYDLRLQDCTSRLAQYDGSVKKHAAQIADVTERVASGETGLQNGDGRLRQVEEAARSVLEKMDIVQHHSIEVNTRLRILESEFEGTQADTE